MSEAVRQYYDSTVEREWRRLDQPLGRVEFESTLRLIRSYFPESGRVIDVGSGPGRYALELTRSGYRVALVEPAPGLLERARLAFGSEGLRADAFVGGDALDLTAFAADTFDAAL